MVSRVLAHNGPGSGSISQYSRRLHHNLNGVGRNPRAGQVLPRSRSRPVLIAWADAAGSALLLYRDHEDDPWALLEGFLDCEPGTFHAPL